MADWVSSELTDPCGQGALRQGSFPLPGAEQEIFILDRGTAAKDGAGQGQYEASGWATAHRTGSRAGCEAAGMDGNPRTHGDDQLEPRHLQPVADPDPGRWLDPADDDR